MERLRRRVGAIGLALLLWQATAPALAADGSGPARNVPRTDEESAGGKMFRKAVRGGQNFAFGLVTELPRNVYYESRDHGALYGASIGLLKGVGLGTIRTVAGLYELLTFPIPVNDYQPVVLPAYPFEPGPTEAFPDTP